MEPSALASLYARFLASTGAAGFSSLAEPETETLTPEPDDLRELEWQSRWFAGDFGRDFTTLDGQSVRVVHFGWWNRGPGPDFRDCVISLNGEIRRGSIELDRDPRDWERHGHAFNPAYNDTVLHLHLTPDSGPVFFTRTADHRLVPRVYLSPGMALERSTGPTPPAVPGRCAKVFAALDPERVLEIMRAAARMRLERKAVRLRRVAAAHGPDQALYQALAEALGYSRNRLPMTVLAQRLPLDFLLKRKDDSAALLFGHAGFLEGRAFDHADAETRAWLRGLWDRWWAWRREEPDGAAARPPLVWHTAGTRPQNHPQRRLAALSLLVRRWPEFRRLTRPDAFSEKALREFFTGFSHPYWDRHYTLQSAPAAKPVALVGPARVTDFLANIVYPWLVPDNETLWAEYLRLAATDDNEKTRRAALRLFGDRARTDLKRFTSKIWQQQALLQIHDDFCLADSSGCARCPMPEQARAFRTA